MPATLSVLEAIRSRRSVRKYLPDPVPPEALEALLEAARWAPSGLNNQPWRFFIVQSAELREGLARCTRYGALLRAAPAAVAVLLSRSASYSRDKDLQGVGAALQSLLLAAHSLGLGACWRGEILNRRAEAEAALGVGPDLELMAVVTVGYPGPEGPLGEGERRPLADLVVGRG